MKLLIRMGMVMLAILAASCGTMSNKETMFYGEQFYLPDAEKAKLEKNAKEGSGRSAFRLARHEDLFGDVHEAIRWYKESYNLGYKKEYSLGAYKSLERLLEEGLYNHGEGRIDRGL